MKTEVSEGEGEGESHNTMLMSTQESSWTVLIQGGVDLVSSNHTSIISNE